MKYYGRISDPKDLVTKEYTDGKNVQGSLVIGTVWTGSGPYTQSVTLTGTTANSKISLQPTAAQLTQLISDGVSALWIENNNGTLTANALGGTPSVAMTMQCVRTELSA